jgi:glycogen(starch) synthase
VASKIARQYDFDVIHAHDWLTYPAGIAAKYASGKPLIIHVHATDFDRSGGSVNPGVYEIEKMGMDAADRIIAVSNLTRNTIIYNYGINPDKVFTVYNAVEPIENTSSSLEELKANGDRIVTFLGRVTLQKGPEYFIEAAHRVLQKMSNVRFVMAGSGELLYRSIYRVAQLRIGDRFHFTGFLKGDDVKKMFALSDVYVMPSVSEPFGISPLEAMQSNVPVIISRQSGVSEILRHAVKIDFWDIDAMADAIYGILNYHGLSKYFIKYGKTEVDNLKWENTAVQVRDIYYSLL